MVKEGAMKQVSIGSTRSLIGEHFSTHRGLGQEELYPVNCVEELLSLTTTTVRSVKLTGVPR